MKTLAIAALLLATACMQKGADGAYRFHVTKPEKTSNDQLKADAKKLGRDLEAKTSEAANKAGTALQHAGERLKTHSEKRH